ncbi:MAG: N-succinylglutamate 5-semialdehyde dehydrogenase [Chlamydiae bacterium]|nr:N-succinylglutamate 5-semialdehyde dehydrogenase [Chlamydiota bacterium]
MSENGKHWIGGKWVLGRGDELLSHNPATGELLYTGTHATDAIIEEAIDSASNAFQSWARTSIKKRIEHLNQYREVLERSKDHLAETFSKEVGKPLWESKAEVDSMILKIGVSIEAYQERCPERTLQTPAATLATHHKPHGVVAVFGPFNFPGHLPNGHIVPALLAGNTVVFKGSEKTPLSNQAIVAGFSSLPPGVLNLVQGGAGTGKTLASSPRIKGIFFTGSYEVGKELIHARKGAPPAIMALEMGGNNPLIVADVADFEAASLLTIQSAYLTSGQRCSSARRLIIIEGREGEEFLKSLIHMITSIHVGPYTDSPEPFMGPVIDLEHREALLNYQATLGSQGGIPLVELRPLDEKTPFLTPGLMDVTEVDPRPDSECFGPLLQLIRVPSFEAALEEANRTEYGLAASLLSRDPEKYHEFFHTVQAGVLNWNMPTTGASGRAPFGGIGKSGNYHPGGYYATDYCAYPVASMESPSLHLPHTLPPGLSLLARS